jgi:uncharacterized protein YoaH (UPF0181 family)
VAKRKPKALKGTSIKKLIASGLSPKAAFKKVAQARKSKKKKK